MGGFESHSADHDRNQDGEQHRHNVVGRKEQAYPVCTLVVATARGVSRIEVIGGHGGRCRCPHREQRKPAEKLNCSELPHRSGHVEEISEDDNKAVLGLTFADQY